MLENISSIVTILTLIYSVCVYFKTRWDTKKKLKRRIRSKFYSIKLNMKKPLNDYFLSGERKIESLTIKELVEFADNEDKVNKAYSDKFGGFADELISLAELDADLKETDLIVSVSIGFGFIIFCVFLGFFIEVLKTSL